MEFRVYISQALQPGMHASEILALVQYEAIIVFFFSGKHC